MFNWWNDLPSTVKDLVRIIAVMILAQIQAAIQQPPTVNVQPSAAAVTVQPSPVVFSTPAATATTK